MCVEYVPVRTNWHRIFEGTSLSFPIPVANANADGGRFKQSVFPLDAAPFIRRRFIPDAPGSSTGTSVIECIPATFGLIPFWAKERAFGKKTYNARAETVAEKPAFRGAWRNRHFGIAPMAAFYEPNWETGKAVRWRIEVAGAATSGFGVAAVWDRWKAPDGTDEVSFSLLTMSAAEHPLMRRFHGPEDEKRMLVILPPETYDAWLQAELAQAPEFIKRFPVERMEARPEPRPVRAKASKAVPVPEVKAKAGVDLFDDE